MRGAVITQYKKTRSLKSSRPGARAGRCNHTNGGVWNLPQRLALMATRLDMVCLAYGVIGPTRLVETAVSVTDAGKLLGEMTNYNTLGLTVINEWTARAA